MRAGRPLGAVLDRMMAASVRHVEPVVEPPPGLAADVWAQMRDETGLLPPFVCQASAPEVLAAAWTLARETWLAGPVGRLEREVVAAGVSRANECPFCVEAHSMTQRVADRAVAGDPGLEALAAWAGASSSPERMPPAPFPAGEIPWMVGTAVTFHFVNRVVNVLLEPSGVPAPIRRFRGLRRLSDAVADRLVGRPVLALAPEPGRSLGLLPGSPLPAELEWAAADRCVAAAVSRTDAALEAASREVYPRETRELVAARIADWDGGTPGPARARVEEAVGDLAPGRRPQAVLALLVALASFRVDDAAVAAFRHDRPADRDLVATVAWPAWLAAKRVGERLAG